LKPDVSTVSTCVATIGTNLLHRSVYPASYTEAELYSNSYLPTQLSPGRPIGKPNGFWLVSSNLSKSRYSQASWKDDRQSPILQMRPRPVKRFLMHQIEISNFARAFFPTLLKFCGAIAVNQMLTGCLQRKPKFK
jgi:hypothetical protein